MWCGVAGSVFYCKQAPPVGAATAFADMRAAYDSLSPSKQEELEQLEAICSLHHHDTKIYRLTNNDQLPAKPLLTEEQRSASPPTRHPLVLPHPETGRKALHGLNSSTWCGKPILVCVCVGGGGTNFVLQTTICLPRQARGGTSTGNPLAAAKLREAKVAPPVAVE